MTIGLTIPKVFDETGEAVDGRLYAANMNDIWTKIKLIADAVDANALLDPFPVGMIAAFPGLGGAIPVGWLACDGSSYLRSSYPALWALLGDTYRTHADGMHGYLPDFQGRTIYGVGSHADVDSFTDNEGASLANRSPRHNTTNALTLPDHTHTGTTGIESATHTHTGTTGDDTPDHAHSGTTNGESVSHTHSGNTGTESNNHTHNVPMNDDGATSGDGVGVSVDHGETNVVATDGDSTTHTHPFTSGTESANHDHAFNTGGASTRHAHAVTVGIESANHTHAITTGNPNSHPAPGGSIGPGGSLPADVGGYGVATWIIKAT